MKISSEIALFKKARIICSFLKADYDGGNERNLEKILPIEIAVSFSFSEYKNTHLGRAAVVAQLVERSLPTLEICSSNTVSDKVYLLSNEKTKVRKNRGREWPNLPTIHA